MRTIVMMAALLLSFAAAADKLAYVGRDKTTGAAVVEHAQGRQSVQVGDEIPGFGRVKSVDDAEVHVLRQLSDAERAALKARGLLPVAAEEMIVHRRDQQAVPVTPH